MGIVAFRRALASPMRCVAPAGWGLAGWGSVAGKNGRRRQGATAGPSERRFCRFAMVVGRDWVFAGRWAWALERAIWHGGWRNGAGAS
jgi:hypothetical protein